MDIQAYSIIAMIGRYLLIIICFLVFVQAIMEIRKESQYNDSMDLASLKWSRKRMLFALGQENIVGRSTKCDVIIDMPTVRLRHFKIYLDCGEWIVVPCKYSEVKINKYIIEGKTQVTDGDKISIGKENLIFNITPDDEEELDD